MKSHMKGLNWNGKQNNNSFNGSFARYKCIFME